MNVEAKVRKHAVNNMEGLVKEVHSAILDGIEKCILGQLTDLVSRGVLIVEYGNYTFFQAEDSDNLVFRQPVTLKLKDQEYIEKLEFESAALKEILKTTQDLLLSLQEALQVQGPKRQN